MKVTFERLAPGRYLANHDGLRLEVWKTCAGYYQAAVYENADTPYAAETRGGFGTVREAQAYLREAARDLARELRP